MKKIGLREKLERLKQVPCRGSVFSNLVHVNKLCDEILTVAP